MHSTQKPEQLLYNIIAISSSIGDIVLDPFGGTMTTATIAKKLGRRYISIEQNQDYIYYGLDRLSKTEFENSDIAKAIFDDRPLRVKMIDMIKSKFFIVGEYFILKNTDITAVLDETGKLKYNDNIYDMHTLAGLLKHKKSIRLNGFDYWQVMRDGNYISIDDIRNIYRQTLKSLS